MAVSNQAEDRIPVIVGVGEFSDHPKELTPRVSSRSR
jgi:acetyl-CoA C-acetyltransferase